MVLYVIQECRLNRASDAKQFRERLQKELSDNGSMSWDKFSKQPHFIVAHYAGKVSYQIEGMMEKNKVQWIYCMCMILRDESDHVDSVVVMLEHVTYTLKLFFPPDV